MSVISCAPTSKTYMTSTAMRLGVRVARKHLSWYFRQHPGQEALRNLLVQIETPQEQLATLLEQYDTGVRRAA